MKVQKAIVYRHALVFILFLVLIKHQRKKNKEKYLCNLFWLSHLMPYVKTNVFRLDSLCFVISQQRVHENDEKKSRQREVCKYHFGAPFLFFLSFLSSYSHVRISRYTVYHLLNRWQVKESMPSPIFMSIKKRICNGSNKSPVRITWMIQLLLQVDWFECMDLENVKLSSFRWCHTCPSKIISNIEIIEIEISWGLFLSGKSWFMDEISTRRWTFKHLRFDR